MSLSLNHQPLLTTSSHSLSRSYSNPFATHSSFQLLVVISSATCRALSLILCLTFSVCFISQLSRSPQLHLRFFFHVTYRLSSFQLSPLSLILWLPPPTLFFSSLSSFLLDLSSPTLFLLKLFLYVFISSTFLSHSSSYKISISNTVSLLSLLRHLFYKQSLISLSRNFSFPSYFSLPYNFPLQFLFITQFCFLHKSSLPHKCSIFRSCSKFCSQAFLEDELSFSLPFSPTLPLIQSHSLSASQFPTASQCLTASEYSLSHNSSLPRNSVFIPKFSLPHNCSISRSFFNFCLYAFPLTLPLTLSLSISNTIFSLSLTTSYCPTFPTASQFSTASQFRTAL